MMNFFGLGTTGGSQTNQQANVHWEWLEDGPFWVPYDANISAQMELAFVNGQAHCTFSVATGGRHRTGANYDVDLNSMIQINQATGFTRKVRRFTVQAATPWEWESDQGWVAFLPESSEQLEQALNAGRTQTTLHLIAGFGVNSYTVDLTTNIQSNNSSGFQRRIRRGTPGAGPSNSGGSSSNPGQLSDEDIQGLINSAIVVQDNLDDDEVVCPVCLESFFDEEGKQALQLADCDPGHQFHAACIEMFLKNKPQCPCCFHFFAQTTGIQPQGTMQVTTHAGQTLPGENPGTGTIQIRYSFPNGTQGPEHPNPGQAYHGTSRTAYLPDTAKGQEVLALLRRSFEQRLTFTIGQSITTGRDNCVVWNGIHHKTNVSGGPTSFGYPDPDYLDRVKEELKAKGIS